MTEVQFLQPKTVDEAVTYYKNSDGKGKILAGGNSLDHISGKPVTIDIFLKSLRTIERRSLNSAIAKSCRKRPFKGSNLALL